MDETTYRNAPFNQSLYLNAGANPSSSGGACHLFGLAWAKEILNDKRLGAQARMKTMVDQAGSVRMMFKSFSDRWANEGETNADEGVAKTLGVKIDKVERCGSFAVVASHVRGEHRTAFLYSFWFADRSAHTIAVYRPGKRFGSHVYVFDPNCGEYKMEKSQLSAWLSGVIRGGGRCTKPRAPSPTTA